MVKLTTLKEAKDFAVDRLKVACECATFEAEQLIGFVTGLDKNGQFLNKNTPLTKKQIRKLKTLVKKRFKGIPLQYLVKKWEFYGLEFYVGKGVLIPRPDTELVVQLALDYIKKVGAKRVFDFCAGSGAIGISVSVFSPTTYVTMVERSKKAFKYLKQNIALNKKSKEQNMLAIRQDIFKFAPDDRCDLLISNPPYIKTGDMQTLSKEVKNEPKMALDGGTDGLYFYRKISENADKYLKKGGRILFEIGFDESESVSMLLRENGFSNIKIAKDLSGNDRAVYGDYI